MIKRTFFAVLAFAAATTIFMFNRRLGIGALCVAFLIAVSRIYFSVHYPSDVLCGITLGIVCSVIIVNVTRRIENKIHNHYKDRG